MYVNQAGYLPGEKKTILLAKEPEEEKEAVYQGYDREAGDLVWRADITGLCKLLSKTYYFQRCGMELEPQYAGKFKRECCHTGTAVRLEDYKEI